jgi:type F conjugative transfer system protein TrbI
VNSISQNGHGDAQVLTREPEPTTPVASQPELTPIQPFVLKSKKPDTNPKEKLTLWLTGAIVAIAMLLFAFSHVLPKPHTPERKSPLQGSTGQKKPDDSGKTAESQLPITDIDHTDSNRHEDGSAVNAQDIARTAIHHPEQASAANLGGIQPFDNDQWSPPPYQPGNSEQMSNSNGSDAEESKAEKDALEKPSLIFVRNNQPAGVPREQNQTLSSDLGMPLAPGTRLRARLEAAVSTAVETPVIAVIEFTYEHDGEILIPAGTKAVGHLQAADRSGYVGIRFDSLLMPDGSSVNIQAAATDLQLRPLKGKVEGTHRAKNIVVRSFAGLGEIAATVAGRGSLNQPLSQGDLLRERAADNIAQASDEQVGRLVVTEHVIVSLPAQMEIYVVLSKPASTGPSVQSKNVVASSGSSNTEQLRQLLQLQRELNEQTNH